MSKTPVTRDWKLQNAKKPGVAAGLFVFG